MDDPCLIVSKMSGVIGKFPKIFTGIKIGIKAFQEHILSSNMRLFLFRFIYLYLRVHAQPFQAMLLLMGTFQVQ